MRQFRHSIWILAAAMGVAWTVLATAPLRAAQNKPGASPDSQDRGPAGTSAQASPVRKGQAHASSRASATVQMVAAPPLGDTARKLRAEAAKSPAAPAKVYTNDNLPTGAGDLSIVGPPAGAESGAEAPPPAGPALPKPGPDSARVRMAEIQQQLATHQRELQVLEQKLGQSQLQYYPNPNEALRQQYSRAEIDKVAAAIDQKKAQVKADQRALADLQDEVRRGGGGAGSLEPAGPGEVTAARKPDLAGLKVGSEEYWKRRFKAARAELARAREQQQLSEDELALLSSQQAHDIGTANAAADTTQVSAKQSEVEARRATTALAEKSLAALEREFQESGAPAEWAQPDEPAGTAPPE